MSFSERLASLDRLVRPFASMMSPRFYVDFYSRARRDFLLRLSEDEPHNINPESWSKPIKLWDIDFNNSLFNAAGMFKSGKGYSLSALQGAGAWLAGTSTTLPRAGNRKLDILHPFLSLPKSNSAINWLGLPNDGHAVLAGKIRKIEKFKGCPIGISVSSDPDEKGVEALKSLTEGMQMFVSANVDFIELNESCPNVSHHNCSTNENGLDTEMLLRLEYVNKNFLIKRNKNVPVIVKYSVDTNPDLLQFLIPLLIDYGFDGINLGNTSIDYDEFAKRIKPEEVKAFEFFTQNFGGGVSGNLIKQKSLNLTKTAYSILKKHNLKKEFHIIRTGGIMDKNDLFESKNAGASINQWYTGYFENFSLFGHKSYKNMFQ